jgi:hypothetical protein
LPDIGIEIEFAHALEISFRTTTVIPEVKGNVLLAGAPAIFAAGLADDSDCLIVGHADFQFAKRMVSRRIADNYGFRCFLRLPGLFSQQVIGSNGERSAKGGKGNTACIIRHLDSSCALVGVKQKGLAAPFQSMPITWRPSRRERHPACGRSNPTRCRTRPAP